MRHCAETKRDARSARARAQVRAFFSPELFFRAFVSRCCLSLDSLRSFRGRALTEYISVPFSSTTARRAFREFLWLSKRNSRTISEHHEQAEEIKRTIRNQYHNHLSSKNVKSDDDDAFNVRKVEDEIAKFLLGKVGYLKARASGATTRELRSRERQRQRVKESAISTTFVLRRGELVNAEKINVESKGARVNDGKLSNEEARTYHERLMKRQYYGKTPPKRSEPF